MVSHLFKQYESGAGVVTPVLKDINLSIQQGEFVAVMGPSGSGKSTLMNILGCLDTPSSGEYQLTGQSVAPLGQDDLALLRSKTLGFVFQGFNLLARRTALHNVALPMICMGQDKSVWQPRAAELLAKVGLAERQNALPNQMSGGQQQRVAIARAIANRPSVVLADEPTGNLDSTTSVEIMRLFQELNTAEGITIILVTHEGDIALFAKRLIKFRDGVIVYDGPATQESVIV
jgi:putative ABC transport system ATP-binding protein